MLESLKGVLTAVKDGAFEAAAKAYLNQKIEKFGTVTNVEIDTKQKTVELEAALKGESSLVQVKICGYELGGTEETPCLVIKRFEASREWLTVVLNDYLAGQQLRIPAALKALL